MRSSGCKVGVSETPKHSHGCVLKVDTVQKEEWGEVLSCTARTTVEKEGGCLQGLDPEVIWHGGVSEQGT